MWYLVCNRHGFIHKTKKWSEANTELYNHISMESNDNCRVSMILIDEKGQSIEQMAEIIEEHRKKLNSHSHGQHVEVL